MYSDTGTAISEKMVRHWNSLIAMDDSLPAADTRRQPPLRGYSNLEDLGFLRLEQLLDLGDLAVVQLLQLLLGVLDVVLGDLVQLLEPVAGVGARVTDGDASFLGELVHDLHQIPPPLLVERGQGHADHSALRRRIQAEVRVADRLLDRLRQSLVPRR